MKRARLVNGPFHGHEDTIMLAPDYVTVDPACPCCQRPHLVTVDVDRPESRPIYRLDHLDATSARYVFDRDDSHLDRELRFMLEREPATAAIDVDELDELSRPRCRCAIIPVRGVDRR